MEGLFDERNLRNKVSVTDLLRLVLRGTSLLVPVEPLIVVGRPRPGPWFP